MGPLPGSGGAALPAPGRDERVGAPFALGPQMSLAQLGASEVLGK